jgi:hypothetical protein
VKKLLCSMFLALSVAGCDKYKEMDMAEGGSHDPYEASKFYADGKSTRLPVPGTIAQNLDPAIDQPASPNIPFPITRGELERGQKLFTIYCIQCHGQLGNGEGMVVQRGFIRPPSFHIDRLKQVPDSHYYNVMSHGYGAMYRFSDVIVPEDRWRIAAYVRALQAAGDAPSTSAADKATLIGRGDREPSTQPTMPPGGTAR